MKRIVIFGCNDFAELVKFYFDNDSDYEVTGFVIDNDYHTVDTFLDLPLIKTDDLESTFPKEEYSLFVAVGYSKMNRIREQKINEFRRMGYYLVNYISSSCTRWSDLVIEDNCFIMENVILQKNVKLGSGVIIWAGTCIGHDSVLHDNVFISLNATLSGNTVVKDKSFIGANATIKDDVLIEESTLVGAGSYISNNTKKFEVYTPTRVVNLVERIQEVEREEFQKKIL